MTSRPKERSEVEAGVTGIHDFQTQRKVRGGGRRSQGSMTSRPKERSEVGVGGHRDP